MRKLPIFIKCLVVGLWPGILPVFSQPVLFEKPLSPRIANYRINVTLDAEAKTLDAQQMLLWYNKTEDPVTELQFHLYLNGFRNSKSSFMKESGGRHRSNTFGDWGFIDVNQLRVLPADGTTVAFSDPGTHPKPEEMQDLGERISFFSPDDGNPDDRTVFRVVLDEPLAPGQSIWVYTESLGKLPEPPFARTGAKNEYFFVGQWFPKIAVFEEGAWNCHQFHLNTEFYADFGVYDVFMTVPGENLLGATGVEVEVTDAGNGQKTHYYHAEDVHDFAWTTSPDYVELKGSSQDVEIRVLCQKDIAYQAQRYLDIAVHSVAYFQDWYGDYPFPNLTVVDPRRGAMGSGGMEYPTLITGGSFYGLPEDVRLLEMVTLHEFGHNFWYHLLASNEFEESWMDEGINTYTEIRIMNEIYGPHDAIGPLKASDLQTTRARYMGRADLDKTVRNGWEYYSNGAYGTNSYSKPGIFLTTLEFYLGTETMRRGIREYVSRFSFKHPTSQDFVDVMSDVAGQDLNWFFDQALYTNKVLDYGVGYVSSEPTGKPSGYDFTLDTKDLARKDETEEKEEDGGPYTNIIKIRRLGDFVFPVEVAFVFENGETKREQWDGKELWKRYEFESEHRLVSATVDPEYKIPLDVNYTNNSKTVEPNAFEAQKAGMTWLPRVQLLLDLIGL